MYNTQDEARAIVARIKADQAMPNCDRCHHPFMEHTGRSLGSMHEGDRYYRLPQRGRNCEHLMDFHHTCVCPRYFHPEEH